MLERLDLDSHAWADNVGRYGRLFHRLAARLGRLREFAAATGRAWVAGHGGARQLYAGTE